MASVARFFAADRAFRFRLADEDGDVCVTATTDGSPSDRITRIACSPSSLSTRSAPPSKHSSTSALFATSMTANGSATSAAWTGTIVSLTFFCGPAYTVLGISSAFTISKSCSSRSSPVPSPSQACTNRLQNPDRSTPAPMGTTATTLGGMPAAFRLACTASCRFLSRTCLASFIRSARDCCRLLLLPYGDLALTTSGVVVHGTSSSTSEVETRGECQSTRPCRAARRPARRAVASLNNNSSNNGNNGNDGNTTRGQKQIRSNHW